MKRFLVVVVLMALGAGAAGLAWWWVHRDSTDTQLRLFGNVDLRQVELAFNNSQRIQEVLVQEGDKVRKGEVLARLDVSRIEPLVAQAEAQAAAQEQIVDRLKSGSRPEEIAQAKAVVESAKADAANARLQYERLKAIFEQSSGGAVSKQELDNAKAALAVADSRVQVNEKALELAEIGPRKEEIAEAEARSQANQAQLAYLRQELADAELAAPMDAVVRTRVMEPGEMASPQRPVLLLAILDPKWIRAYVSETDLGRLQPGAKATIGVDSFPGRRFEGWVGFISPVAEFTPKAVQTEELRTNLVYEVRVFVTDPDNELRLGMPATVYLSTAETADQASKEPKAAPGESEKLLAPEHAPEGAVDDESLQ